MDTLPGRLFDVLERDYDIGSVQRVTPIRSGPGSIAWRVNANLGTFCLKEHKRSPIERVREEHALIGAMRNAGYHLIPNVVPNNYSSTVTVSDDRVFALYDYVFSDPPFDWTNGKWGLGDCVTAGAALKEFHQWAAIASGGKPFIHGDFHPGNVLFKSASLVAVLDLDYCRIGNLRDDLAYGAALFGLNIANASYSQEKAEAFWKGYNRESAATVPPLGTIRMEIRASIQVVADWLAEQGDMQDLFDKTMAILSDLPD